MYTFIQQGSIKWIKIDSKTITLLQKDLYFIGVSIYTKWLVGRGYLN